MIIHALFQTLAWGYSLWQLLLFCFISFGNLLVWIFYSFSSFSWVVLKTYSQGNSKRAVPQIFINDIHILLLYILPEWLFDRGSFIWLIMYFPFFKSYYVSHLILVTLNTKSFTSFNKWLSSTDNCHWTFICIGFTASCWLPSWEKLIYYYLPHLLSFLSWEIINPTYSHLSFALPN